MAHARHKAWFPVAFDFRLTSLSGSLLSWGDLHPARRVRDGRGFRRRDHRSCEQMCRSLRPVRQRGQLPDGPGGGGERETRALVPRGTPSRSGARALGNRKPSSAGPPRREAGAMLEHNALLRLHAIDAAVEDARHQHDGAFTPALTTQGSPRWPSRTFTSAAPGAPIRVSRV